MYKMGAKTTNNQTAQVHVVSVLIFYTFYVIRINQYASELVSK